MNKQAQRGEMICHEPVCVLWDRAGFGPKSTIPNLVFLTSMVHCPKLLHDAINQQKTQHPVTETVAHSPVKIVSS